MFYMIQNNISETYQWVLKNRFTNEPVLLQKLITNLQFCFIELDDYVENKMKKKIPHCRDISKIPVKVEKKTMLSPLVNE